MAEEMGDENIFIFGMKEEEVEQLREKGYNAMDYYNNNPELKKVTSSSGRRDTMPWTTTTVIQSSSRLVCTEDEPNRIVCRTSVNSTKKNVTQNSEKRNTGI